MDSTRSGASSPRGPTSSRRPALADRDPFGLEMAASRSRDFADDALKPRTSYCRRVGFIVTNFQTSNWAVVRFYNQRATAEQWIKEGKQAVTMTRLSCHRFSANEVQLWLSLIA